MAWQGGEAGESWEEPLLKARHTLGSGPSRASQTRLGGAGSRQPRSPEGLQSLGNCPQACPAEPPGSPVPSPALAPPRLPLQ